MRAPKVANIGSTWTRASMARSMAAVRSSSSRTFREASTSVRPPRVPDSPALLANLQPTAALARENRQKVPGLNGALETGDQLLDSSRAGGADDCLHLHRLEGEDRGTGRERLPWLAMQRDHQSGHRGRQLRRIARVGEAALR